DTGTDGTTGANALVVTTDEPAGEHCPNGGFKLETGIDANGDDELDEGEVTEGSTRYVCNGTTPDKIEVTGGGGCSLTLL
ncbi:MAG TPA: hypothetical protein P5077_13355, partial [bacterium]|nr:hypothetical protein [bacterium]